MVTVPFPPVKLAEVMLMTVVSTLRTVVAASLITALASGTVYPVTKVVVAV